MSCRKRSGKDVKNGSHAGIQEFSTCGNPPPCPPGGNDKWNLNYCTLSGWSWTKKDHPSQPTEMRIEPRRSRKSNLREVLMCCLPGVNGEISTAPSNCTCLCEQPKSIVSCPSSCDNLKCPYRRKCRFSKKCKCQEFEEYQQLLHHQQQQQQKQFQPLPKKKGSKCKPPKKTEEPITSSHVCSQMPPILYYHCHCHCCDKNKEKKSLENKTTNTSPIITNPSPALPPPAGQRSHSYSRERCDYKLLQSMAEAIFNESGRDKACDIYNLETPYSPLTKNFHLPKINRPSRLFMTKPPFGQGANRKRSTTVGHQLPESTPSTAGEMSDIDKQLHNLLKSIKVDSTQFLDNPSMRLDDPFV